MTAVDVYISNLGHALGERQPIGDLPEVRAAGNAELLAADGLDSVRVSDREPWELAVHSARSTLSSRDRHAIASVFYATDSFWPEDATVRGPARFLDLLELGRTPLRGVGLEGCANAGALLAAAANAVVAGTTSDPLCVTTDRAASGERLMGANVSVLSDGAASFIASRDRPDVGFRLLAIASAIEAGMHDLHVATNTIAVVKASADGIGRATSLAFERAGVERSAVAHVVANNYGRTSLKIFCAAARVPFELLHTANIGQVGHCFAADTLINLESMLSAGVIRGGERCLMLCSGFNNWSAVLLECIG